MITRRFGLLAAASTLAAPAIAQAIPEIQTIRSTAKSWIWMVEDYAINGGFFQQAGLKVTANSSGRGTNMSALVGASVDVEWGDPGEALNAKKENLAFRSICQIVGNLAPMSSSRRRSWTASASPRRARSRRRSSGGSACGRDQPARGGGRSCDTGDGVGDPEDLRDPVRPLADS